MEVVVVAVVEVDEQEDEVSEAAPRVPELAQWAGLVGGVGGVSTKWSSVPSPSSSSSSSSSPFAGRGSRVETSIVGGVSLSWQAKRLSMSGTYEYRFRRLARSWSVQMHAVVP